MRKILLAVLLVVSLFSVKLITAQSCFNVNAGKDTNISCLQNCFNLKAKIPDVRTSDDYQVVPINYAPFPYTNPGGVVFNPTYIDDSYSSIITLPFTFCFYGNNYTQCVVGTNGIITFELTNANTYNSWLLNLGTATNPGAIQPIPYFAGGIPNDINSAYYPRACIMGPYHDIDPEVTQPQPPKKKMEYIVVGNAPCRKFVLNFYQIPYYGCPNEIVTQQMVLYEGTGIIDIFLENKPLACGNSTNEGRAILGIQNWERDKAVTVNNRNNTVWSAVKEGWRFVPNGTTSLLSRAELYKNNVLISTVLPAAIANLGNGELEATFNNICQSEDSMSYVVKAFYKKCDNPVAETEGSDTMIVYKTLNPLTLNVNAQPCPGTTGSITVVSPVGANIEYSINGGTTWQTSTIFTPGPGNYTITARVIGSQCTGTASTTILPTAVFYANGNVVNLRCNNTPTGNITFSPIGPNAPYQFSSNGGVTYQAGNVFSGLLAGTHNFKVKNSIGCIIDTTLIITEPPPVIASAAQFVRASCYNNDGELIVTASGGTPFYTYSLDGLAYQKLNSFTGLASGTYTTLAVKDANGCVQPCNATTILVNDQMFLTLPKDTTICAEKPLQLIPVTNTQTNIYKWAPATALNFDDIKTPVATPSDTTHYVLTAQWGICSRTAAMWVNVLRKPVSHAGNDTVICYNAVAFLNGAASNTSGPVKYLWWPATVTPVNTPVATVTPDSTRIYALIVNDNYGCHFSVSDSVLVTVRPKVIAFAGNDTTAIYGVPQQLSGTGGTTYTWLPAGSLNNPFIQNPLATLYNDTRFSLLVSNDIGCTATDEVLIKVYKGPTYYIPNAFTPNGDGVNDKFTPIPVGIASTQYFRIFDRFGQLVFSSNEFLKGWDGKYKGNIATTGTYVWMIKGVDKYGKVVEMKGTVIVVH